jgi:hypothetical protein
VSAVAPIKLICQIIWEIYGMIFSICNFTDTHHSQQGWSSETWRADESAGNADLEYQPSHVKSWATRHVLYLTLVHALWVRITNSATVCTGKSLSQRHEGCCSKASRKQDCQRTTICCKFFFHVFLTNYLELLFSTEQKRWYTLQGLRNITLAKKFFTNSN